MNETYRTKAEAEKAAREMGLTAFTVQYMNVGSVRNPQPSGWAILLLSYKPSATTNPNASVPPPAFPRGRWS